MIEYLNIQYWNSNIIRISVSNIQIIKYSFYRITYFELAKMFKQPKTVHLSIAISFRRELLFQTMDLQLKKDEIDSQVLTRRKHCVYNRYELKIMLHVISDLLTSGLSGLKLMTWVFKQLNEYGTRTIPRRRCAS